MDFGGVTEKQFGADWMLLKIPPHGVKMRWSGDPEFQAKAAPNSRLHGV
jgi:hypothetical protein